MSRQRITDTKSEVREAVNNRQSFLYISILFVLSMATAFFIFYLFRPCFFDILNKFHSAMSKANGLPNLAVETLGRRTGQAGCDEKSELSVMGFFVVSTITRPRNDRITNINAKNTENSIQNSNRKGRGNDWDQSKFFIGRFEIFSDRVDRVATSEVCPWVIKPLSLPASALTRTIYNQNYCSTKLNVLREPFLVVQKNRKKSLLFFEGPNPAYTYRSE